MELTPEMIEKMRTIGLRLDREGTFWQADDSGTAPVTHARLRQALLRWLDVRDDGRDIIKLDDKRYAYVEVEDAHLRARSARWDGDRCMILWDDDQDRELDYASLRQTPDHALYVRIPARGPSAAGTGASARNADAPQTNSTSGGKLRGRIAGPAYHAVAENIVERDGSFVLVAAGRDWPIADGA